MCLLIVLHRVHPDAPLVVAASRDEFLSRPATAMTILRESGPRVLGGRDEQAGGTWLAVNEAGVFAAVTNRPGGRDPSKRSRGELPLALASVPDAETAVDWFRNATSPSDYSPCWLLAGDRRSLFAIDMTAAREPAIRRLDPGLHVAENRPPGEATPKTRSVAAALKKAVETRGEALRSLLQAALADHRIPLDARSFQKPELQAHCVHSGPYGTRSSTIVIAPEGAPPSVWYTDGPPCAAPFQEANTAWRSTRSR